MGHTPKESSERAAKPMPSGQERMKRKTPADLSLRPQKFESDPKKAYSAEQLAEIGAITLKWNQIEAHIDFIGTHILLTKTPFWLQMTMNRALSTKSKLSVLKECLKRSSLIDEAAKNCIHASFAEVENCRAYRNAIIHHHIYDHAKGIGSYTDESKSSYQILVSLDALTTLYNILCSILLEMREIDMLFRIETDAQRPGQLDRTTGDFKTFDEAYLSANIIPEHVRRIQKLQDIRKRLHKLPQFPDSDIVRAFHEREDDATK